MARPSASFNVVAVASAAFVLSLSLAVPCAAPPSTEVEARQGARNGDDFPPEVWVGPVHDGAATARPTLHCVATAHLDTQWLWTIQPTITDFVPATLRDNFALFRHYPDYTFNFEGAFRYRLAKEYYPKDFEKLKDYVAAGRWHVCGSSVDAGDVNVPAPESLIRHVLLGNWYYRHELGTEATDIYLPDCFGFGWALPTVAAHCGLRGFSTQKLTWGSSVGIPFDIGAWEGVDGSSIVAALRPGDYVSKIREDLSQNADWLARAQRTGAACGVPVAFHYFGTGDQGGAPDEDSVRWLERSIHGKGPLTVDCAPSDRLYGELTPDQIAKLPRWSTEMLMTRHGTGCYTSQAAMKRFNRKNEQLAAAAERAAVAADWLGGATYPKEKLREAWIRFLWHHHHDDLTGTSTPLAYPFSWNDEVLSEKDFADVITDSVGAVARDLDTKVEGVPLVVFNPLAIDREDVVEARVTMPHGTTDVQAYGPDGKEIASQIVARDGDEIDVLLLVHAPSLGFTVIDVRPSERPCALDTGLAASPSRLSNGRLQISIDSDGDIAHVLDREAGHDLLAAPSRLELREDTPDAWPEWEIWPDDEAAQPSETLGAVKVRVVESGPVRATVEIQGRAAGSFFTQRVSLAAGGAGGIVDVDSRVDWSSHARLLKATFPLAASAPVATYDLGIGTIDRGVNREKLYEVPGQQWADQTVTGGAWGTAILNDCKTGWDKPDESTLRLTLIHSPHAIEKDFGWHRFKYAIAGHAGDWRAGGVQALAARYNAPLEAFVAPRHLGRLGRRLSLLEISSPDVALLALKKAEDGDEVILRLVETSGRAAHDVEVRLFADVASVRDVTGQETAAPSQGPLSVVGGALRVDLAPYRPRTLALTLDPGSAVHRGLPGTLQARMELLYDTDVVSEAGEARGGDFDGEGHSLPADLMAALAVADGDFIPLSSLSRGAKNAVTCRGQSIGVPRTTWGGAGRQITADTLHLVAAASGGDVDADFELDAGPLDFRLPGGVTRTLHVSDFTGWVGQSQSLVVDGKIVSATRMEEPFVKPDHVAWVGTHRHDARGRNEPYVFCYLFDYAIPFPSGGAQWYSLRLPNEPRIKILGAVVGASDAGDVAPASEIVDDVVATRIRPKGGLFVEPIQVTMSCDRPGAVIHYTLDGSDPTLADAAYAGPVAVSDDATVRARAFFGTRPADYIASRRFERTTIVAAVPRPSDLRPGLKAECFEGKWRSVAPMLSQEPVRVTTSRDVSLTTRTRDLDYGLRLTGFIDVPKDGVYTFTTTSDDGSTLAIGDEVVVDNDGLHGATERSGSIALAAGVHPITVLFFQLGGDIQLDATWEGPGIPRAPIPTSALWRLP